MDPKDTFCKASKITDVLNQSGHRVNDDIERFRAFRSLVRKDEKSTYDRLVMHWDVAEKTAPGAGNLLAKMLEFDNIEFNSIPVIDKDDVFDILKDSSERYIITSCYDMIGSEGSVEITKGYRDAKKDRLDVYDTYRFDLNCAINVPVNFEKHSCSVVVIDGYIEQVSEIHHLLAKVADNKSTLLIFARGYSPDVLNTLSVNLARKTLDAYPFIVPLELGHINDMYDIALVTGSEVVSSDKGQLISMVKQDRLANVQYMKYSHHDTMLMLRNDTTKNSVMSHVQTLRARAETTDAANLPEIMTRIRKLTSLLCVVSLKPCAKFEARHKEIKTICRSIDHYLRYGIVSMSNGERYPGSALAVAKRHLSDIKVKENQTVAFFIR